ncbi:MAG: hypothetical protein KBT57_04895 [bacterium]|nr:hypothetical protein [Candidatus Limimorpha equi]
MVYQSYIPHNLPIQRRHLRKHIRVRFIDRIRSEVKLNGLEELKAQLGCDKEKALEILKNSHQ